MEIYRGAKRRGIYLALFTDPVVHPTDLWTEKTSLLFDLNYTLNYSGPTLLALAKSIYYDFVANLA